jgi:hypothetical protein
VRRDVPLDDAPILQSQDIEPAARWIGREILGGDERAAAIVELFAETSKDEVEAARLHLFAT